MTGPLRVFVSSTMKDLVNERDAVVSELRRLNFEPVNAEAILPTGEGSWEVIDAHIRACDLFVLILGDSYGWSPTSGPHANEGKSVTELEYLAARRLGLPVLPFLKNLGYDAPRSTEQAKLRDRFRRDVEAWEDGQFRTDFDLARDLAAKVGRAISLFLAAKLRELEARRVAQPSATTPLPTSGPVSGLVLPDALVKTVADRSALLFVGAGMSLQAGLPSAYAFTEFLLAKIGEVDPGYARGAHGGDLNDVASDLARLVGVVGLRTAVEEMMSVEGLVGPSAGQRTAVTAFDLVVTTNYDTLLEKADSQSRLQVVSGEIGGALPGPALVKLHGTVGEPSGLVLTRENLGAHDNQRRGVIKAVREQIATRPVIVVGSSLTDPTTRDLFAARQHAPTGWMVTPHLSEVDRLRLSDWNLVPVEATAEEFFGALTIALERGAHEA